ncbi:MAG: hypothetical protein D6694_04855 [Gammaproteobacteria bacterium]|nr:MAG: hypothetical protein D6694_04855 [Gammaproteobacteria bacterium]
MQKWVGQSPKLIIQEKAKDNEWTIIIEPATREKQPRNVSPRHMKDSHKLIGVVKRKRLSKERGIENPQDEKNNKENSEKRANRHQKKTKEGRSPFPPLLFFKCS